MKGDISLMLFIGLSLDREAAGVCCVHSVCMCACAHAARAVWGSVGGRGAVKLQGENANANTSSPTRNGVGFLLKAIYNKWP